MGALDLPRDQETVSVIVPTLNAAKNIRGLILSIYSQNYRPIEVIVVDGGLMDGTTDIVQELGKRFSDNSFAIRVLRQRDFDNVRSLANAWNIGLLNSNSRYIVFFDSDFLDQLERSLDMSAPTLSYVPRVEGTRPVEDKEKTEMAKDGGDESDFDRSAVKFPTIGIIIPNLNGKEVIRECLHSLEFLTYPNQKTEIIVVDNGSTDGSIEVIMDRFPRVKIISLGRNYGFCYPCNVGAEASRGDYLVFLNNDTVVTPAWLTELVRPILADPMVKSVVGKILYYPETRLINVAGGKLSLTGGYYIGYGDSDKPQYDEASFTGFGTGSGVLVERRFFLDIGGFDPDYFASMEEVELGWQIWLRGYRVFYNPRAIMFHRESYTFGKRGVSTAMKVFLLTRNTLQLVLKIMETKYLLRAMSALALLELKTFFSLFFKQPSLSISILRGYISFFKSIKRTIRKRRAIRASARMKIKDIQRFGILDV